MAGEAFANAVQSRTRFGVLLKALAVEHEHLWEQTQNLHERSNCEAGGIPIDDLAKNYQDHHSMLPAASMGPAPPLPASPLYTEFTDKNELALKEPFQLGTDPDERELVTDLEQGSSYSNLTAETFNRIASPVAQGTELDKRELGKDLEQGSSNLKLTVGTSDWIASPLGPSSPPDRFAEQPSTQLIDDCNPVTPPNNGFFHVVEDDDRSLCDSIVHSAIDPSRTSRMASASVLVRLQLRLGIQDWHGTLNAPQLHTAVTCLGVERYNVRDMERLIVRMARVSPLADIYESECDPYSAPSPVRGFLKRAGSAFSYGSSLFGEENTRLKIPLMVFAEFLISTSSGKKLGKDFEDMLSVLREILVAGDANRLVAELTSVRIDDLAAPPPVMDWDMYMEPIIGFVILLNGIAIGLQTEQRLEDWDGWAWVEATFALLYALELWARIWWSGFFTFYCGNEAWWSIFDTFIVICAIIDTAFEFLFKDYRFNMTAFTIVRTIRLTRLTRMFRIFRLGFLRELTIMVKGLIAGFRTLLWANVLLLFTIYIIAVFATYTFGQSDKSPEIKQDGLFISVPQSMFTSFRCFVGDCNTSKGQPIMKILGDIHGMPFVVGYWASFTVVTLGLFNLINALYVEIAMAAAKSTEANDKSRAQRESLRVAHITKKLLKKFCAAQRYIENPRRMSLQEVTQTLHDKSEDQDIDDTQTISSELFLLIIQDQEVQRLMDDLDVPPDRANLFDVLDADGTGDLHVTELVHGLLKVRGEARKSDVIASLLAVRAAQDMIRLLENKMLEGHKKLMDHFGIYGDESGLHEKSIWNMPSQKISNVTPAMSLRESCLTRTDNVSAPAPLRGFSNSQRCTL